MTSGMMASRSIRRGKTSTSRAVRRGVLSTRCIISWKSIWVADDPAFSARNRRNGQLGHRIGRKLGERQGGYVAVHGLGIFRLVPPKVYGKSHPEYYGGGQLRFGNEAVRDIAMAAVRQQLAKWPQALYYLLIPHADRGTYYRGGKDKELIKEGGAPSAAYVDFVRVIAEAVQADFPYVTVLAQAYQWSRKPPTQADLPAGQHGGDDRGHRGGFLRALERRQESRFPRGS